MRTAPLMQRRNFFLPERVWVALKEKAVARQTTISDVIRQILMEQLGLNDTIKV